MKLITDAGRTFQLKEVSAWDDMDGHKLILIVANDITEARRVEELLVAERNLGIALSAASRLEEAIPLCLKTAIDVAHTDCGGMYLFESSENRIKLAYAVGLPLDFLKAVQEVDTTQLHWWPKIAEGSPIYSHAKAAGRPLEEHFFKEGLRAIGVMPVLHQREVIACLIVASHTIDNIPVESRQALETIASQLGGAFTRMKAEERLRESEQRYRNILANIEDGYYEVDLAGNFVFCNRALAEVLGCSSLEDIIGKSYKSFCTREMAETIYKAFNKVYKTGEPVRFFEGKMLKKNGTSFYFEQSITLLRGGENEPIGFCGILRDITQRKMVETELQLLSRRLLQVQENERHRLARELHDEFGQALTALKIKLQTLLKRREFSQEQLEESIAITESALQGIRQLSLNLRPSLLDDLGLAAALHWHVNYHAQLAGIEAEFVTNLSDIRLSPELEITCYRIAQEAFTNVVKHSRAGKVRVELIQTGSTLFLSVEDDGCGFDVPKAFKAVAAGKSMGLLGMKERVALCGGELEIDSAPGRGTKITAAFELLKLRRSV